MESVYSRNRVVGSNPTLSAILRHRLRMAGHPNANGRPRERRPQVILRYAKSAVACHPKPMA